MPTPPAQDLKERLDWAVQIAQEAGDLTLRHFRHGDLRVDRKADDSPVTVADREAEELMRRRIGGRFPDDGLLGEEFGAADGTTGFQWVLDPIDGTKSFIHGVALYTTLVAVLEGQEPRLGVIHAPACRETIYAAVGGGCWYVSERQSTPQPARVSRVGKLREGLLLTGEVATFAERASGDASDVFLNLHRAARIARTWGDGYGYLMVATGRAEAMIDPAVNLWDVAPLQPIVEEAGGRLCDWQGRTTVHSGDALATNGLVTDEVLALTQGR
jgi:histidinol phosphatase-like enzyme (inositol monophosphatase family)